MAAYTTIRFNYHMLKCSYDNSETKLKEKIENYETHFDARVFNVPTREEGLNNVLWRSVFDCRRNSVSALAITHYSTKELHKLGTTALIEKLKKEKDIDWEKQVDAFKFGSFIKKECYEKEAEDLKTKQKITVTRTKLVSKSFNMEGFSKENIDLVFRKYW